MLDDRSSSDEENYNILLSSAEQEAIEKKTETPTIFGIDLNVNDASTNLPDLDDASSDESESDYSDNQSDADEKSLDSFNESDASTNLRNGCVSENTSHSYSNSLLEDEEDDANDGDLDDEANKSSHLLSDFNNGKDYSLTIFDAANSIPIKFFRSILFFFCSKEIIHRHRAAILNHRPNH